MATLAKEMTDDNNSEPARMMAAVIFKNFIAGKSQVPPLANFGRIASTRTGG